MIRRSTWSLSMTFVFAVLTSPLFGQKSDLPKSIIGAWSGNSEATKKYWEENKIEPRERLLEDATKMSITFMKDGKLKVQRKRDEGKDVIIEGTFKVVKTDTESNELTLKFIPASKDGPEEIEVKVKVIVKEKTTSLAITPQNDPAVVFTNNKPGDSKKPEQKKVEEKKTNK